MEEQHIQKVCHWCTKPLVRPLEDDFLHCFECNLQRLGKLTLEFDPCPACQKTKETAV